MYPRPTEEILKPQPDEGSANIINKISEAIDQRESIRRGTATLEEVEQWYVTHDPMMEAELTLAHEAAESNNGHLAFSVGQHLFRNSVTTLRAGSALAASCLLTHVDSPSVTTNGDLEKLMNDIWLREFGPDTSTAPQTQSGINVEVLALGAFTKNIFVTEREEDLHRLFTAAEMMDIGARELYLHSQSFPIEGVSLEEIEEIVGTSKSLSHVINQMIMGVAIRGEDGFGQKISPETQVLGVKAGLIRGETVGRSFNGINDIVKEDAGNMFYTLCYLAKSVFDGDNRELAKKLRSPLVQGDLHQLMWLMDSYVLKSMDPDTFGNVEVRPSYRRSDEPKIGIPKRGGFPNRGYDFEVASNRAIGKIQLKTSNKREHPKYHPQITLVVEDNFMDLQPKRLKRKMQLYSQWAESGFDTKVATELKLESYILKSVKNTLSAYA